MTKAAEYKNQNNVIKISVSDGEVWAIDDTSTPSTIGVIDRVELSIEEPEETPGVYRIEHIMLFDSNDEQLYEDQDKVDNEEYYEEDTLIKALAKSYGVSTDLIEVL